MVANVRPLDNGVNYTRLGRAASRFSARNCCAYVHMETRVYVLMVTRAEPGELMLMLHYVLMETGAQPGELMLMLHRDHRAASLAGKRTGDGLAVCTVTSWCRDAVLVSAQCSPLVDFHVLRFISLFAWRCLNLCACVRAFVTAA